MSTTEEATVNPDGSTTFEAPPLNDTEGDFEDTFANAPPVQEVVKGIDPAFYLIAGVALIAVIYYFFIYRKKAKESEEDFFSSLDGEKFNLELPGEVEEYYQIKEKCVQAGWTPGQRPDSANTNGPHRVLAQALMKRAIADIPMVTHIQKESTGMNKLYSQSMCSVRMWQSYQAAEVLVSSEVEDVRNEADEIEPGWSNIIWRQAMQYHQMLKQRHEQEAKAAEEASKKQQEETVAKISNDPKAQEAAAEKAAQELLAAEEREKESKKAFSDGLKKGFIQSSGKGKKK